MTQWSIWIPASIAPSSNSPAEFPDGAPSLLGAASLTVKGDVRFEQDVIVTGDAHVSNDSQDQLVIPRGTHIS